MQCFIFSRNHLRWSSSVIKFYHDYVMFVFVFTEKILDFWKFFFLAQKRTNSVNTKKTFLFFIFIPNGNFKFHLRHCNSLSLMTRPRDKGWNLELSPNLDSRACSVFYKRIKCVRISYMKIFPKFSMHRNTNTKRSPEKDLKMEELFPTQKPSILVRKKQGWIYLG